MDDDVDNRRRSGERSESTDSRLEHHLVAYQERPRTPCVVVAVATIHEAGRPTVKLTDVYILSTSLRSSIGDKSISKVISATRTVLHLKYDLKLI